MNKALSLKKAAQEAKRKAWDLKLFVLDSEPRSEAARKNLALICDRYLKHNYHMEVVDLRVHPEIAKKEQILAIPTLQKLSPEPQKIMVGDFSILSSVLKGLGVKQ